jgi:cyclophilin family peptidyl-prolyl cis-trans isomerase/HEAT repeat protein
MLVRSLWALLFCCIGLAACGPKSNTEENFLQLRLDDAVVQQIFNFKNKRNTGALLPYLAVENPRHRYAAVLALGSVQDSSSVEALGNILKNDEYERIRQAAAFALGQTQHHSAAKVLAEHFRNDSSRLVQSAILEAVGRAGTEEHLKFLCAAPPYPAKDTLLQLGWVKGLYRFAQRGLVHPEGTSRIMKEVLANLLTPNSIRLVAAQYLVRAGDIDLKPYEEVLINNVLKEKKVYTLLPLTLALSKVKSDTAQKVLSSLFKHEDYRVRVNIARGWQHFPYDSVRYLAMEALRDTHVQVRMAAADYFYNSGNDRDGMEYHNIAKDHPNWAVALRLEAAALRHLLPYRGPQKMAISQQLISRYQEEKNELQKHHILQTLGEYPWNYRFLIQQLLPDSGQAQPLIASGAAKGLSITRLSPSFERDLGLSKNKVESDLNAAFRQCFERPEPGVLAILAELLLSSEYNFKTDFPDFQFIEEAAKKLKLPQDLETFIDLQRVLRKAKGLDPAGYDTQALLQKQLAGSFSQIDFPLLITLGEEPKWVLETTRGKIVMVLYPLLAPTTVNQMVQLTKSNYFNDKHFHRLVPNFVAQGGCPRGDGWGGIKLLLPSEFGLASFDGEGYVGMASAGKDTEGAQFFLTHSPTLHLDGRYTLFGKVIQGMEVMHQLQLGDVITKASIE